MFIFELGSLICGVSSNSNTLIVGRAIAGVGVFLAASAQLSLFRDPRFGPRPACRLLGCGLRSPRAAGRGCDGLRNEPHKPAVHEQSATSRLSVAEFSPLICAACPGEWYGKLLHLLGQRQVHRGAVHRSGSWKGGCFPNKLPGSK